MKVNPWETLSIRMTQGYAFMLDVRGDDFLMMTKREFFPLKLSPQGPQSICLTLRVPCSGCP